MSATPKTILAFGEVLWDLLPTGPVLGGAPFNFAHRLHGLGERARMVSRLGADDLGEAALAAITAAGMETGLLQTDPQRPTGTVHITFDADSVADIRITPDAAYDGIDLTPALLDASAAADCLCFGTVAQRGPVSRTTLHALLDAAPQALKLYDINLRRDCFSQETVDASLARTDVLKLNGQEAGMLARMFDLPFIMTSGGPDGATETLSYTIYYQSFREFNFGYGTAIAVVLLVVTIIVAVVQSALLRRREVDLA